MAPSKLLNLLALSFLAILACFFVASPVNAVSVDLSHNVRHVVRAHTVLAKKKRGAPTRCKQRPSSSSPPKSTPPPPQKTTAPSSAPPPPPPPPPPSSGGGKIGLAWPNGEDPNLPAWKTNKVSTIYTWSPFLPSKAKGLGLNGIPMLWGPKQIPDFQRLVKPGYANTIFGFNEPDIPSQSNLSPADAAGMWKQYLEPLRSQGYRLISPATVKGPEWLKQFMDACNGGCHLDGLNVHFYGTSVDDMIKRLTSYHDAFNLPIYLTEFACQDFGGGPQCSRDQVFGFMSGAKKFLDSTPWIVSYSWFGVMHDMGNVNPLNRLMGSDGKPNDLGWLYLS
jgi:hypothetical protein